MEQQFVRLLQNNNIFTSSRNQEEQFVLFVGEGDARHMASVQKAYPAFKCFGIEPVVDFANLAKTRVDKNKFFVMTAEEFVTLLPESLSKKFNTVIVSNYNVTSHPDKFMRALNYCAAENGQVVIGVSFTDGEFPASDLSIMELMKNEFGTDNVKKLTTDYNFTQVLYAAKPSLKDKCLINQTQNTHPLAKKINALHHPFIDEKISQLELTHRECFADLKGILSAGSSSSASGDKNCSDRNGLRK